MKLSNRHAQSARLKPDYVYKFRKTKTGGLS
jgi:hypothetical protein